MKTVDIWTDGACSKGRGGWAALLVCGKTEKVLSGRCPETTNNRMEMTAVLEALKALTSPCDVRIRTDSEYVCNAFNKDWLGRWQNNDWETSEGLPVKNQDLWEELLQAAEPHTVEWLWVKGHANDENNCRVDQLAVEERIALEKGDENPLEISIVHFKQALDKISKAVKYLKQAGLEYDSDEIKDVRKKIRQLVKTVEAGVLK